MLRCDTDILQCLDWNIQHCLLWEDQGGYLKSQCVSVEEPPKTNILNVTSISANVCRSITPHLCFCLWLETLLDFMTWKKQGQNNFLSAFLTLSHHNLIWHKKVSWISQNILTSRLFWACVCYTPSSSSHPISTMFAVPLCAAFVSQHSSM